MAYHPDGTRLVTAASDNTVRFWDAATGELVLTLPYAESVYIAKFTPDGRKLAVAPMNRTIQVLATGR